MTSDLIERLRHRRTSESHYLLMAEAADHIASLEAALAEARVAIEEFGTSRVRDRIAARVGCNHDILHDALQQEVRRAARTSIPLEGEGR